MTTTAPRENDKRMKEVLAAIRRRICRTCLDGCADGRCGLTRRGCAVVEHLPTVVELVAAVDGGSMEAYYDAVEREVCWHCPFRSHAGPCRLRQLGECALHASLADVVAAVRSVD
jgi:hypothetical protein